MPETESTIDLLLPAEKQRTMREVFPLSFSIGAWWLALIADVLGKTTDIFFLKAALLIISPALAWLALVPTIMTTGAISTLLHRRRLLRVVPMSTLSGLLFFTLCSAVSLRLIYHASTFDRALGALWFMGLIVVLTRNLTRRMSA